MQNFYLFCKRKSIFSILHTHIYKTLTSVYLFYHLFYLNNHFPHFFLLLFISNSFSPLTVISNSLSIPHLKLFSPFTVTHRSRRRSTMVETHRSTNTDLPQVPIHSLCLCWCVCVWVCLILWCLWLIFDFVFVGVYVSEEEEDDEGEKMRWFCKWRRKKKKWAKCEINKILVCKATVIVHICMVTIAFLHICTILQALMWVFFFFKMCKINHFLVFCSNWCDCSYAVWVQAI